jgi:DNA (cytosine-5)-methyltransferase 1
MTNTVVKPPYKVPSMAEIEAIPWNGFNAISTFSGAGGSCLGYRMAGFKVLWASEFIPAAQEVYQLNHPGTILDTRDIRNVQPQDILDAIGLGVGDIDLMDGSPPCASFSTAGKREKSWGEVKKYSDTKQRVDDLFFEYVRLLDGLQPKVFIAENVSGLVKGKAKGYFKLILQAMKDCGYQVKAKLLDAQWLGVPQIW